MLAQTSEGPLKTFFPVQILDDQFSSLIIAIQETFLVVATLG